MKYKIEEFIECDLCSAEKPDGVAMVDWAQLSVGATDHGLQVWCERHDVNVLALDFRGKKIPFDREDEYWGEQMECADCGAVYPRHTN